jgi:hypothetical protein
VFLGVHSGVLSGALSGVLSGVARCSKMHHCIAYEIRPRTQTGSAHKRNCGAERRCEVKSGVRVTATSDRNTFRIQWTVLATFRLLLYASVEAC